MGFGCCVLVPRLCKWILTSGSCGRLPSEASRVGGEGRSVQRAAAGPFSWVRRALSTAKSARAGGSWCESWATWRQWPTSSCQNPFCTSQSIRGWSWETEPGSPAGVEGWLTDNSIHGSQRRRVEIEQPKEIAARPEASQALPKTWAGSLLPWASGSCGRCRRNRNGLKRMPQSYSQDRSSGK